MAIRIGIDLGGTKIEGVALEGGRELARLRVKTPRDDYAATLDAIVHLVAALEHDARHSVHPRTLAPSDAPPHSRTLAPPDAPPHPRTLAPSDAPPHPRTLAPSHRREATIGVGIPGALSPSGLVKNANSVWLIGRALGHDLDARLGRPVRVANDANCFALSEAADGAAANADVVFGVICGTGTGGGIVVRRHAIVGPNAVAGEWGHNPLPWAEGDETPGPACYCGKRGCIETFLSGPGLTADHERATGRRLPPPDIVSRAAAGDADADRTLTRYEHRMARALASVINLLDPDVIVLGGGLSEIDRLYRNVPQLWDRWVFAAQLPSPNAQLPTRAVRSRLVRALHGAASGVRGAARLWADPEEGVGK